MAERFGVRGIMVLPVQVTRGLTLAIPARQVSASPLRLLGAMLAVMVAGVAGMPTAGFAQQPPPVAAPQAPIGGAVLEAVLTDDGQRIDQGLVWRVYLKRDAGSQPKLIATHREPTPTLKLPAGDYTVNVGFGRAHLTRKIVIKPGETGAERFVLNAGGLKLIADIGGAVPAPNTVNFQIQSDETSGNRATVISGVKPGLIVRLNAGIYQVVSTYGDANAVVRADVTVEAGKMTEAAVSHAAAKVAFKLVAQPGGDAFPDTQWTIQTLSGEIVKESVGAIPTHVLAPGTYAAIARRGAKTFRRDFLIRHGDTVQVEVIMQ